MELYQPKSGILTVKYAPDGENVCENPPRFSWMPANDENGPYLLEISKDQTFEKDTICYKEIDINFFAPDSCLATGNYYWRYALMEQPSAYSAVRTFCVTEDAAKTPIPSKEARFKQASKAHPRLWLSGKTVQEFREKLKIDPHYCKFDSFCENAVMRFVGKPLIEQPKPYPDNKRVIALWRQNYLDCQTAFNHIRFLSIAGVILENQTWIQEAITALLDIAKWKIDGPTGRDYNDESAFRVTGALAWGYDWLYNEMTEDQRKTVYDVLYERTRQVAQHALVSSKIHYSLFDSHAVRSLSSVLMPCCIALLHECPQAMRWLNYTVDYLNVLYTPWGGTDGGWSEGGLYWTTGMAYLIEALNLLKNYTGMDLFKRPFFKQTGSFPLYCFAHDTYRASFCDQSNLGDKPILKTGFNAREFAGVTQNGEYQWYFEQIAKRESYDDTRYVNTGWWDFYYDEMVHLFNYENVVAKAPAAGRNIKWFHDIGWVALHSNMQDEKEHICFITKSSPYGSVSHSHGDQNSMLLFAFGDPLLIESGYYIGFNSAMHRKWRKETKSQNTLLFDGRGQYSGMDKTVQLAAVGKIESVIETETCVHVTENATAAYLPNVPALQNYTREIYFVDDSYFVIVDTVSLQEKMSTSFLLHTLYKPEVTENHFSVQGPHANLQCEFVYTSSGIAKTELHNEFTGVDEAEVINLDRHWHFALHTNAAYRHVIVSCLYPRKNDSYSAVETIKDDQGHDVYFYFNHDGKTFSLCIDGNQRY